MRFETKRAHELAEKKLCQAGDSMPRSSVYDVWVASLLRGEPGEDVLARMRAHYTSEGVAGELNMCTLRTKVSDVKRRFLESTPRGAQRNTHPSYAAGVARLRRAAASSHDAAVARAFLTGGLMQQLKDLQRGELLRSLEAPAARDALEELRVLPDNMDGFVVPREVYEACTQQADYRLLRKKTLVVPCASTALARAQELLGRPDDHSVHDVIAALLFASGRRTAEVLNGRSSFDPLPGFARGCLFRGQLKTTPVMGGVALAIPLLVDYGAFRRGLQVLRRWQGNVSHLSNKAVSTRFQPGLSRHMAATPFGGIGTVSPHAMRAVYMRVVLLVFDWGDRRDKRVAKYCLGHLQSPTSDHYDHVKVRRGAAALEGSFGRFPLHEAELRRIEEM